MRLSAAIFCVAAAVAASTTDVVRAQESSFASERLDARRELEWAKIEFRDYWQIVYPRIRRELDARIDLTEEEVRIYRDRLWLYRPFDRFSRGDVWVLSLRELRMCLREAEWRLRDLRAERNNLIRFRTPEWRMLEQRVHDARLRVAEIESRAENVNDGPNGDRNIARTGGRLSAVRSGRRIIQGQPGRRLVHSAP